MRLDGTVMQLYERAGKVESDSRSHTFRRSGRQLVESLENMLQLIFGYSLSTVTNGNLGVCIVVCDMDADVATWRRKLKGIREDIHHHLVEVATIHPYGQLIRIVVKAEPDVLHLGLLCKQGIDIVHETNEVGFAHTHLHLSLVNLPEVHHLVNQSQDTFSIAPDSLIESAPLWVIVLLHQREQRSDDKCHRCTYLMTDVHEEAKFRIRQFLCVDMLLQTHTVLLLPAKMAVDGIDAECSQEQIAQESP